MPSQALVTVLLAELMVICLALSFVYAIYNGIRKGSIVIRRGFETVSREKQPLQFWTSISLAIAMIIFLLLVFIIPMAEKIAHLA
jgi:archaellum biogenesis protein FlaJ (TadC family)